MGTFAYHADNPKMSAITGNTVASPRRKQIITTIYCNTP